MAAKPRLLLVDEPVAGLNLAEAGSLLERLRNIRDMGVTLMLVEHNMDLVMDIGRGYVLQTGQLIASRSAEELRGDERVRETYLGRSRA